MPILVRPVREQLEHDRVIRLLQAKYKRKFEVGMNPGTEQSAPIGSGSTAVYPDLVLQSTERSRKLMGVVEVETGESVNNLEAMSQWVSFARLRAPFHLYVPANMIDVARRLCVDMQIPVAEIWTYHAAGDQVRFTLVQKSNAAAPAEKPARPAAPEPPAPRPAAAAAAAQSREASRPARRAPAAPAARRKSPAAKAARPRAAAAKTTPARGRASTAKKKTASTRSARTQKRK